LTAKLASLIGVNNSIRKETKTETNRLHTPFSIFDSSSDDSSANDRRPVIVFAHGGGYVAGSVDLYSNFLTHLATETEAIVVAPHYRLAPRRMWPGQFDDVKDVLTWIVDHPEDLENADFSKIIIAGDGLGAAIGVSAAMQVAGNGIKKGEGKKKFFFSHKLCYIMQFGRDYKLNSNGTKIVLFR
jgi:acetyl esterase/lipase